jgi:FIMAH domain-containing protein
MVAPTFASQPPNLLDDNRDDTALSVLESGLFTAAIGLLGFSVNPLIGTYLPVDISGRVLAHPKIHNLYLDDDWDAHNPDAPTSAQLDAFTRELASSHYLDGANQYGVHAAEFTGSHGRSLLCSPLQPRLDRAEFVELLAWVSCEVSVSPPVPGLIPPLTGVPQTNDDSLYVIYLPRSMDIVDGGCGSLSGVHFFGAAPNFKFLDVFGIPLPIPVPYAQTFAYAVIPTKCASGDAQAIRDHITEAASHEIIESATDPLVGTGWINNIVTGSDGNILSLTIDQLSNVGLDLRAGEVADICEFGGTPGPPAFQHPTSAVMLPVNDPSLDNRIKVAPYWSNADAQAHVSDPNFNACVPFLPTSKVTFGSPNFTGAGGKYVTSATTVTIEATNGGDNTPAASVSYRSYPLGATPPDFTTQAPPVQFTLTGVDGPYVIETFATGSNGFVEVSHSVVAILDNTAPVSAIVVPAATQYTHSDTLTLNYSTSDGAGSGVASAVTSLDGSTTLNGHGLASGQIIPLLTELALGPHSFTVAGVDNVGNSGVSTVSFEIVVTPDSIKQDVNLFLAAGLIKNSGMANSLLAMLSAAEQARARGNCSTGSNDYDAFIHELQAQSGNGIDASAAAIMIGDAQYLIAHCP